MTGPAKSKAASRLLRPFSRRGSRRMRERHSIALGRSLSVWWLRGGFGRLCGWLLSCCFGDEECFFFGLGVSGGLDGLDFVLCTWGFGDVCVGLPIPPPLFCYSFFFAFSLGDWGGPDERFRLAGRGKDGWMCMAPSE